MSVSVRVRSREPVRVRLARLFIPFTAGSVSVSVPVLELLLPHGSVDTVLRQEGFVAGENIVCIRLLVGSHITKYDLVICET